MTDYTVGPPQADLPPVVRPPKAQDWSRAYFAARQARGAWVPIVCMDRAQARQLKDGSKKQPGVQAVLRGSICYLRVRG